MLCCHRNRGRLKLLNFVTNVVLTVFSLGVVSLLSTTSSPPTLKAPPLAGIPQIYHFGQEGLHNILVIDLLGPSLEDLFDMCGRKFSIKTVCMAARQMVCTIYLLLLIMTVMTDHPSTNYPREELDLSRYKTGQLPGRTSRNEGGQQLVFYCHTHVIPRLINPDVVIHVVDFGMAKQYRDPKTKQHIPYRERKSLSGTARYMSINTHLGRGMHALKLDGTYKRATIYCRTI
jgi:serine/threonine protein kinase